MQYCKICNSDVVNLTRHIKNKHKDWTLKQYYDLFLKKSDTDSKCLCCGKETSFYNLRRGYAKNCSYTCGAKIGQHKRYLNPEEHEKARVRSKTYMENHPELKEYLSKKQKARFEDINERIRVGNAVRNSELFKQKIHSEEYSNNMHNILIERYKSEDARQKMSEAIKNSIKANTIKKSEEFRIKHSNIMHDRIQNGNINTHYIFNNVNFRSLPEFCFYVYLIDHSIRFSYQAKKLPYLDSNGITHFYIPDFIVYNTYVEIKGPHLIKNGHLWNPFSKEFSYEKEQCMIKYNVKIFTKEIYIKYINYVLNKYGQEFINSHRKKTIDKN